MGHLANIETTQIRYHIYAVIHKIRKIWYHIFGFGEIMPILALFCIFPSIVNFLADMEIQKNSINDLVYIGFSLIWMGEMFTKSEAHERREFER